MSSLLRHPRRSGSHLAGAHISLDGGTVPARAHAYPGVEGMAMVVVLDGSAIASATDYRRWGDQLSSLGFTHMRTGALSPRSAIPAELAGMMCVQQLALMELLPDQASRPRITPGIHTRSLDHAGLAIASQIDRAAFGTRWWLDESTLGDVCRATPKYRARIAELDDATDPLGGFLISGRAGRTGYIQRLAVHPERHRTGFASVLLADAFAWMRRHRVQRIFVNTHVDNEAALALYRAHHFTELRERLAVHEGPTAP
jgi:ribosomal protein S18 acetylase RimI-like enzyme